MPVVELMEQKWPIVNSGLILFSDCCDTGYMKSKRIKSFHERQTDNGVLNDGWTVTAANCIPCHCMNTTKCKRANSIFPVLWNYITKFCLAFSQILMKISHHDTNTHTLTYTRADNNSTGRITYFFVFMCMCCFFFTSVMFKWNCSISVNIEHVYVHCPNIHSSMAIAKNGKNCGFYVSLCSFSLHFCHFSPSFDHVFFSLILFVL